VWLALACHRLGISKSDSPLNESDNPPQDGLKSAFGMASKARELIHALSPANRAKEYKTEPYYLAADIYTNPKAYGRGGWSIYTGSAGWYYILLNEIYGDSSLF
jgi:hypothetical protein